MLQCPEHREPMLTPKEILALRKKWYQILKKEGFVDIEVLAPDGGFYDLLKHQLYFDPTTPERQAQEKYYALARAFNYDFTFKNTLEQNIWKLHSEGVPIRTIKIRLGSSKGTVHKRIKKFRKIMLDLYLKEIDDE